MPAPALTLSSNANAARPRGRSWARCVLYGGVLGLFVALVFETVRVTFGSNLHTVVPGQCYRSAQLSGPRLATVIKNLRIRTVINLRGANENEGWYQEECTALRELGIHRVDIKMSGYEAPVNDELCKLLDVLENADSPVLVHCYGGSDRSGFAAALFLLLKTNASLNEARAQIGVRYGHNPFGAASCQSQLLDAYQTWLSERGQKHSPANLRGWIRDVYHSEGGRLAPRRPGQIETTSVFPKPAR
jgi:protein tyrosine phosphatase (PTP) superfamily phosphohydrolase (DUF442 family)